jgi:hypothetical protein
LAVAILTLMLAATCAAGKAGEQTALARAAATVSELDAPPAAVRVPDAPGLNVEDLAARLRDAMGAASGIDVVDELSVRRELAACTEAPCPDDVAERYGRAAFVVASSVSPLGAVFLSTVRVLRGVDELVRTSAQAPDARASLESAGRAAGALLRKRLVEEGVTEKLAMPDAHERPGDTDRGGDE